MICVDKCQAVGGNFGFILSLFAFQFKKMENWSGGRLYWFSEFTKKGVSIQQSLSTIVFNIKIVQMSLKVKARRREFHSFMIDTILLPSF